MTNELIWSVVRDGLLAQLIVTIGLAASVAPLLLALLHISKQLISDLISDIDDA